MPIKINGKVVPGTEAYRLALDSDLTISGAAADAKVVGDALNNLRVGIAQQTAYIDSKTEDMASKTWVGTELEHHNNDGEAHSDLRNDIGNLQTTLETFFDDSDTNQMSQILQLIDANGAAIQTLGKNMVSTADIVNNLDSTETNKVLSAAQGAALSQSLIDHNNSDSAHEKIRKGIEAIEASYELTKTQIDQHESANNPHGITWEMVGADQNGSAKTAYDDAVKYTDGKIELLMNNSSTAIDSIMELAEAMADNADAMSALTAITGKKADAAALQKHVSSQANPHGVTFSQVGADEAGTATRVMGEHNADGASHNDIRTLITQTRTAADNARSYAETHASNKNNPHSVTYAQVGADAAGTATNMVTSHNNSSTAHSDIRNLVSSARTAADAAQVDIDAHTANKSNPHGVSLSQLGVTATAGNLNCVDVTSSIQGQLNNKVSKAGDTMTGKLMFDMHNPHIHMKDIGYDTNWYFQAYQDQLAFGPTFDTAVKTDKNGNMTVPGTVHADIFKSGTTEAAIKPSDSNEINFGSNANYIFFGYDNRVGSSGKVDTYRFGTHSGAPGSTQGAIECGSVKVGSAKTTYDSANECLNFVFE